MNRLSRRDPVARLLPPGPDGWNVLGSGFVALDLVHEVAANGDANLDRVAYLGGGTASNILCHLSRFGWQTAIVGAIGDDETSVRLRSDLQAFGVDTATLVPRPGRRTTTIVHGVQTRGPDRGRHTFGRSCLACSEMLRSDAEPLEPAEIESLTAAINDRTLLIVDRANPLTNMLADKVRQQGGVVVFEPGHIKAADENVTRLIANAQLLKFSDHLTVGGIPFRETPICRTNGPDMLIETRSTEGVRVLFPEHREIRLRVPSHRRPLDSAGAGDAFTAALVAVIGPEGLRNLAALEIRTLEAAILIAQVVGGLATLFLGAKGIAYDRSVENLVDAVRAVLTTGEPPAGFAPNDLEIAHFFEPVVANGDSKCSVCGTRKAPHA
jgi:sugar/nucleoside kinase (ribokinase family)